MRRIAFNDSSDDDNNHVAGMDYIDDAARDSTERTSVDEANPGWLQRLAVRATTVMRTMVVGGVEGVDSEPFEVSPELSRNSPATWRYYDAFRRNASTSSDSTPSLPVSNPGTEDQQYSLDLREAILQYQRTPEEFYLNIILAVLKSGEEQVSGDVFSAAAGNRFLLKTLLESGHVSFEDPVVQAIVQNEVDVLLIPVSEGQRRTNPEIADYLGVLCSIKSVSISREQMLLCKHSGFEFVKILNDCPHILRNIPPRKWVIRFFMRCCEIVDIIVLWMGFGAILLNIATVVWITYYWFTSTQSNFGYWTILTYVGGFVASLVATVVSQRGKIEDYGDRLWDYPDSKLRAVPGLPMYETAVLYVTLRYECTRKKEKYFFILHDLYTGLANLIIIDTICYAFPQLLVQYYLFDWGAFREVDQGFAGFWTLVGASYASFGMSIYLFLRRVSTYYSCSWFGFAVFGSCLERVSAINGDIVTHFLIFILSFVLETNAVFLFISILNTSGCTSEILVLTSVSTAVVALTVIALPIILALDQMKSRLTGLVCLPALIMQVVYSSYVAANPLVNESVVCVLFAISAPIDNRVNYMTFAFLCVTLLLWTAVIIYELITGNRINQQWLDQYLQ